MSCCCTNTYDLGCVTNCGTLEATDLIAPATGTYTLEISTPFAVFKSTFTGTINEPLEFDLTAFNESEQIVFKVKQPSGDYYTFTDSPTTYDCFTIKTKVEQSV